MLRPPAPVPPKQTSDAGSQVPGLMWRSEAGELIPLDRLGFDQQAVEELLQRVRLQDQVPLFSIGEVRVQGRVERDVYRLTVSVLVTVMPEREWVQVPVGFSELQVSSLPGSVARPQQRALFNTDASGRKEWWLYGKGIHELSVELIGQIRNTPTGRPRIRFTAPTAARSHLLLEFGEPVDEVTGSGSIAPQVTTDAGSGRTTIELWGISGDTDITWKPQPADTAEHLLVQASTPQMTLDLRTVPASLSCRQTIDVSGGSVDSIRVRLPPQFRPVSVTSDSADGSSIVRSFTSSGTADDGSGRTIVVRFAEPVRGSVALRYDLELSQTEFPLTVSLSVPDVELARNETGNIDILIPPGLLVEPDAATLTQVRRKRVESLTDTKTAATAYQLLSSEARIDLRVSEIEAFFAVEPQIEISAEENNNSVLLTARFPVSVIHGSLNETTVLWKDFAANGWQIWPGSPVLTTDDGTTPLPVKLSEDDPDKIQLVFPDRQTGQFLVELRAFRNLTSFLPGGSQSPASTADGDASASGASAPDAAGIDAADSNSVGRVGQFYLPDVVASTDHATTVTLVESDAWSVLLTKPDGVTQFSSVPVSQPNSDSDDESKPATARLVEESGSAVRIQLTSQQPEVRTSAVVSLQHSPAGGSIHVHAELLFQIRHRDLNEVRLVIPDNVIPAVRLHGQSTKLAATVVSSRETAFQLPVPTRGELLLDIDYHWTPAAVSTAPRPQPLHVPLVLPSSPVNDVTVGTDSLNTFRLASVPNWVPVYSDRFAAAWRCRSVVSDVPVELVSTLNNVRPASPRLTVSRSVISLDAVTTLTTAVFDSLPATAIFNVPSDCDVFGATVNGQPVELVPIAGGDDAAEVTPAAETLRQPSLAESGRLWRVVLPQPITADVRPQPATVGLRVRQRLNDDRGFVANVRPGLPAVSGSGDGVPQIWLVSADDNSTLAALRDEFDWSPARATRAVPLQAQRSPQELLQPMLAVYDTAIRTTVMELLAEPADSSSSRFDNTVVLVGSSERRECRIVVVTTKAILLCLSLVGVASFMAFLRLQRIPLITLSAGAVAAAAIAWALLPEEFASLYWLSAAGILLGAIAALVQRMLASESMPSPALSRSPDQSTIFAVDRGTWLPSSAASGTRPQLVGSASSVAKADDSV